MFVPLGKWKQPSELPRCGTNLVSLSVLTHERLVIAGERRSVVVDVQHPDVNRDTTDLPGVV